jgi:hypothetical protein
MQEVAHPIPPAPAPATQVLDYRDIRGGTAVSRLAWAILFLVPTAVLTTAAFLHPAAIGHGTHTQLGLPPCGFLVLTGLPCPGCGLTTSFANMIRGDAIDAARANAFGILLFLVTLTTIPIAAVGFVKGWRVVPVLERLAAEKWAVVLACVSLTVWVTRLITLIANR